MDKPPLPDALERELSNTKFVVRDVTTTREDVCEMFDSVYARLAAAEAALHAREMHPDYEYTTTDGPRKSFDQHRPEGEGWEVNIHQGREGWDRFEYHEVAYWMRRKPAARAGTAGETREGQR